MVLNSTNNVLDILFLMKNHNEKELGLNEISKLSEINKSTVYKILNTLIKRDIIGQNPDTQKYFLSYGLLELSNKVLKETNLYEVAHPVIKNLARTTGKTITLGIKYDDHLVFIDRIDGNESVHFHCEIGKRMPFYEGAAAKSLFAFLPNVERREFETFQIDDDLDKKVRINKFIADIDNIREQGYSISDEEVDKGVFALGAPVFNHRGDVVAGIALATIKNSVTNDIKNMLIKELLEHSMAISKSLGYTD